MARAPDFQSGGRGFESLLPFNKHCTWHEGKETPAPGPIGRGVPPAGRPRLSRPVYTNSEDNPSTRLRFSGLTGFDTEPDESTVATRVAQTLETGHPRDADNDALARRLSPIRPIERNCDQRWHAGPDRCSLATQAAVDSGERPADSRQRPLTPGKDPAAGSSDPCDPA